MLKIAPRHFFCGHPLSHPPSWKRLNAAQTLVKTIQRTEGISGLDGVLGFDGLAGADLVTGGNAEVIIVVLRQASCGELGIFAIR